MYLCRLDDNCKFLYKNNFPLIPEGQERPLWTPDEIAWVDDKDVVTFEDMGMDYHDVVKMSRALTQIRRHIGNIKLS